MFDLIKVRFLFLQPETSETLTGRRRKTGAANYGAGSFDAANHDGIMATVQQQQQQGNNGSSTCLGEAAGSLAGMVFL